MKKPKIFLVAVLILLVISMVACEEEPVTQDVAKAPDCFVLEDEMVYTKLSTLEGVVVGSDDERNLIALQTEKPSRTGGMQKLVTIYDLVTGEAVYDTSGISVDWTAIENFAFSMINYPLVEVGYSQKTQDEDGDDIYESVYHYHLVNAESYEVIADKAEDRVAVGTIGNMYLYGIEDTLYWVNKDGEIVRKAQTVVSDTYTDIEQIADTFGVDAEYKGYLYTWDFSETGRNVQIYDRNGVCIVDYNLPQDTVMITADSIINPKAFVLNNGDLLVQYATEAAHDAAAWDVMYASKHFDISTVIIDRKTAEVKTVECDFVVSDLESAYSRFNDGEYNFELELASGYDNQAYIVPFANGYLAKEVRYTVLDNTLAEKYVLENEILADYGIYDIRVESKTGYIAQTVYRGNSVIAKFDWDGNLVAVLSDNAVSYESVVDGYYVTPNGVYADGGELKFDLVANGFVPEFYNMNQYACFSVIGNKIYLYKYNPLTGGTEVYSLNTETWSTTLLVDGVDVQTADSGEGYYKVKNTDTDVSILYNSNDEAILKVRGDMNLYETDDVAYVTVTVDGSNLVYVINAAESAE